MNTEDWEVQKEAYAKLEHKLREATKEILALQYERDRLREKLASKREADKQEMLWRISPDGR